MTTLVARPTRARHSGTRQQSLALSHQRLMLLMLIFLGVACVIAGRIVWMNIASAAVAAPGAVVAARADLVDRNGAVLARTIEAHSIGVHPNRLLGKPELLAPQLARLMPERSEAQYLAILKSGKSFTYLRRRAMPELVA